MTTKPDATDIRVFAEEIVGRLREAGHEALFAGGCVRDLLLGKVPKDYDVATSARPEQVQAIFPRTVAVGVSFGVVRVVKGSHLAVEVATFRADGAYKDGRHPDAVRFTDAREDALRRDFTINGMFLDPTNDAVLDFVGGREDLEAKRIRAIGDPAQRFREDKLRLLRAVRFATRLDFTIDEATFSALQAMAPELGVVSAERILMELRLLLDGETRGRGYLQLGSTGLGPVILEECAEDFAVGANQIQLKQKLDRLPADAPFSVSIAVVFAATDAPDKRCDRFFKRLKGSNEERELSVWLLKHRDDLRDAHARPLSFRKRLYAYPHWRWLAMFTGATSLGKVVEWCEQERQSMSPTAIDPPPLITGDDLQAAGFAPGPEFKTWLERIRDMQLDGSLGTAEDALKLVNSWSSEPKL
jgi:poly(A) polymerase